MHVNSDSVTAGLIEETRSYSAQQLVEFLVERFGDRIALATSFGAEDQVLTDMLCRVSRTPAIFTLDTGRLPEETYRVMEATRKHYGVEIEVLFPDRRAVEAMVTAHGPNLFYESIESRKRCCQVRKVEPLERKLSGLSAWICGLRAEQSLTRDGLARIEFDQRFGLIKAAPLADWGTEAVWGYIRENGVPYNALHDRGYPSIGCAPCSRAVKAGDDIRSGRWWWEAPEHKECGLHWNEANRKND